jgi:2-iminobutanoate/2-iminopropanoate deaminase
MIETIQTPQAPQAVGPYSQAVTHSSQVFCSGQIGLVPESSALVEGGVATETQQALKNLSAVLDAAGSSKECVVKTDVYLTRMDDFAAMNEVYAAFFGNTRPARVTVGVAALPKGACVEIACVAVMKDL